MFNSKIVAILFILLSPSFLACDGDSTSPIGGARSRRPLPGMVNSMDPIRSVLACRIHAR